jgi:hypothetical protein
VEAETAALRALLVTAVALTLAITMAGAAAFDVPAATAVPSDEFPESEYCLTDEPPPPDEEPHPIRFGNTPLTAGSVGPPGAQEEPVPRDAELDMGGMLNLRPPGKELVVRMNRMFWADGREGIDRYIGIADRYGEQGFAVESQVRYHPPEGEEGDMEAWEDYVREVAQVFGTRDHIVALSITNEGNVHMSPNTSDGWYEGVEEAIVVGTLAARDELDRMGREDIELGFSFAWRMDPPSDRDFWQELGELGTEEFVEATDYVGLQIYPGKVWPPQIRPGRTAGEEVLEAAWLLRDCFMPQANLGHVDLWITENGYGTNLGDSEEEQEERTRSTLEAIHEWSGTLGLTDYRWFNLRDNRTDGVDVFSAVGLMRDDYTAKPAFCVMREGIAAYGTDAPGLHGHGEICEDGADRPDPVPVGGDDGDDEATDDREARTPDGDEPAHAEPASPDSTTRTLPVTGGGAAGPALAVLLCAVLAQRRRRS